MTSNESASGAGWILAGEDGTILAASKGYGRIHTLYPHLQEFLKMWHRVWYRARPELPNYERELGGSPDRPPLRIKATPMMLTSSDGSAVLSDQLCGILIEVSNAVVTDDSLSQFGLTAAELRVAEMVVAGKAPADIAEHFGLSVNTVRVHMKRLFMKTGVHSRADLVRVLFEAQLKQAPEKGKSMGQSA